MKLTAAQILKLLDAIATVSIAMSQYQNLIQGLNDTLQRAASEGRDVTDEEIDTVLNDINIDLKKWNEGA